MRVRARLRFRIRDRDSTGVVGRSPAERRATAAERAHTTRLFVRETDAGR